MTGQYDRVNIAIYQVHLQSQVFNFVSLLARGDVKRIGEDLERYYGKSVLMGHFSCDLEMLPESCKSLANGIYKVEFFLSGAYYTIISKDYKLGIPCSYQATDIAKHQKISPKFVDTMGMLNYKHAIPMWNESLYSAGMVVKLKHPILFDKKVRNATIRICSHIFNASNFVTVTNLSF